LGRLFLAVWTLHATPDDEFLALSNYPTRNVRVRWTSRYVDISLEYAPFQMLTVTGYTAAGLLSLANQAPSLVSANYFTNISVPDGEIVRIIGIMAGLFIILFAYWFFIITTIAVIFGSRRMSFSLNWWAFIFPNAGLTLATIQAGKVLHSEAINGVASALTILLVIMWFVVAAFCIRAVFLGQVLWPGKDEDKTMARLAWGWRDNQGNPEAGKIRP
jgi:tellurite resistance protein TehA-like permease